MAPRFQAMPAPRAEAQEPHTHTDTHTYNMHAHKDTNNILMVMATAHTRQSAHRRTHADRIALCTHASCRYIAAGDDE